MGGQFRLGRSHSLTETRHNRYWMKLTPLNLTNNLMPLSQFHMSWEGAGAGAGVGGWGVSILLDCGENLS